MRTFSALFTAAIFSGCTFSADGYIKPGYPDNHDVEVTDSNIDHSGYAYPVIVDTYAECWLMDNSSFAGTYAWYFEAIVDYTNHDLEAIEEVWIDVYDGGGLLFSQMMYDEVDYEAWLQPPAAAPFGYATDHNDGVFMYSNVEEYMNLKCNSNVAYDIYTTVYDIYGNYETTVEYL